MPKKQRIIYKISIIIVLLLVIFTLNIKAATVSSAEATLSIIENNICHIDIIDNAYFEKKITSSNMTNKEITIGLTIKNNNERPVEEDAEIVLLLDNSYSMQETISIGGKRVTAVERSAKTLVNSLMEHNNIKMSIVSFSSATPATSSTYITEGTMNDAKLRLALTDNKANVLQAIDAFAADAVGSRTNLDAGLTLANQQFSGTIDNKYIIVLTDGVPNLSLSGGTTPHYSDYTATATANKLNSIGNNQGVHIISMLTGVPNEIESTSGVTYEELAEEIFGTPNNPTTGSYYYITDDLIENTVTESILGDIISPENLLLKDIDIKDFIPTYITDNFNVTVETPSKGTVSEDATNNAIIWHLDELDFKETATLSYTLKLKTTINEEIINEVLDTNVKVDLTTENVLDYNDEKTVLTSYETPKISVQMDMTPPEATVIIKYLEKGTNTPLDDDDSITGIVGDSYSTSRKDIPDYGAVEPEPSNASGVMTEAPITVKYYYAKNTYIKVQYLEKNTENELYPEFIKEGLVGDSYNITRRTIDGYSPAAPEPTNNSGLMTAEPITIKFYYSKNTYVTTKYLEVGTNLSLADDEVTTGVVGTTYSTTRKEIPGYGAALPEPTNKSGTMTADPITVTYYYGKYTHVLVKHIDKETDQPLTDDETISGVVSQEYTAHRKTISGYEASEPEPDNKTGVMTENPITVTFYYEPILKKTSVIVKYIDKDTGEKLYPDYTINGKENDSYEAQRRTISGYVAADPEPTNKKGTMTKDTIIVTFYYKKKDDTIATGNIPQTGAKSPIVISMIIATISSIVIGTKVFVKDKDII